MIWHTKINYSITTMARRHAPKKHVRKKLSSLTSAVKRKSMGGRPIALYFAIVSARDAPLPPIFHQINVGTSMLLFTTTTIEVLQLNLKERCHQEMGIGVPVLLVFDRGRRVATERSKMSNLVVNGAQRCHCQRRFFCCYERTHRQRRSRLFHERNGGRGGTIINHNSNIMMRVIHHPTVTLPIFRWIFVGYCGKK